ncbi:MAG: tetratricopeptide repeat protein [Thermoplasmata archaeon]|nr:MAG: tetratricopeptide repeat protein [Thermoplasmata archaeon]
MPSKPGLRAPTSSKSPQPSDTKFDDYLKQGNEYWASGNNKKALKFYDLAITENPEDERPWNNKGIILRNFGKIDEARECFKKAVKLNPHNSVIKRNLKSLDKPITSSAALTGIGAPNASTNIVPMLKYEVPQIMITAVVLVSPVLFCSIFLMFKFSESLWYENFSYVTLALTIVSFLIILISLFSQLHYLVPIIEYEIRMFLFFLLGTVLVMIVPIHESLELWASKELWSAGNISLFILGGLLIAFATTLFYIKGGYFLPWLLGIVIFMTMAFHESFKFVVFTNTFGIFDQTTAVIGIILTFIGLFLFLTRKIVNSLLIKSENLRSIGKYDEAMKILDWIIKFNPYNEVAWNDKGNVLYHQGDFDGAIRCYTRAIELDSRYDIAQQNLSLCKKNLSPG